jgi:hypothetical protein
MVNEMSKAYAAAGAKAITKGAFQQAGDFSKVRNRDGASP